MVKKENFRESHFSQITGKAMRVIIDAKDDDLLVLDIEFRRSGGIMLHRARLYTRKVFDDILAGR
ncbi:MAG: hypothetical protein MUP55_01020 [Candidatus Aenigmarchaeota archaeon]|nr:hypothetical protein [Candidatus Aenigmarchaeota archaeon]